MLTTTEPSGVAIYVLGGIGVGAGERFEVGWSEGTAKNNSNMRTDADLTEAGAVSRRVEIVLGPIPTTDSSSPSPSVRGSKSVSNNDGLELGCGGGSLEDEDKLLENKEEEDDIVLLDDVTVDDDSDSSGAGAARWGKGAIAIKTGGEAGKVVVLRTDDTTDPLGLRNEVS